MSARMSSYFVPTRAWQTWIRRVTASLFCATIATQVSLASNPDLLVGTRASDGVPQSDPAVQGTEEALADGAIAARGAGTELTWLELDPILLVRRAMSKDGRSALQHLCEVRLLEKLGQATGTAKSDADVDAQIQQMEKQFLLSGKKGGLDAEIRKGRLTRADLKALLRLAGVQETLTRRALGIAADQAVTSDQQRLWIEDELEKRQLQLFSPPWNDDVVAHCSEFSVSRLDFLRYLRQRLPVEVLREDCHQTLLVKRMRARMPDLAPAKLAQYVADEIKRRRDDTAADPKYQGLSYDKILAGQGVLVDRLAEDPAVLVAALSRAWVDRSYDAETLRHIYENERDLFDGSFGPAVETWSLFLRAAAFKNDLNPRTFDEAQAELAALAKSLSTLETFKALAKTRSEDGPTREDGGRLGWVTSRTPKIPPEIQREVAKALEERRSPTKWGSIAGPVRTPTGCVLLWLGSHRLAPTWQVMSGFVHRELRRRFIDEVLQKSSMVTTFEGE